MPQTDYAGLATTTTLQGLLLSSAGPGTVVTVVNATGWPTGASGLPFVGTFGRGTSSEEKILFSSRTGNNLTISQRGYDDTVAATHQNGETVAHTNDATLLRTASAHIFDTTRDDHTQYVRADGVRTITGLTTVTRTGAGRVFRLGTTTVGQTDALSVSVYGAAAAVLGSGADFDGTTSNAHAASATQLEFLNSGFNLYANIGLTAGTTYSRTKVFSISGTGDVGLVSGGRLTFSSGGGNTSGTATGAGSGSGLPTVPAGYLLIKIDGTTQKIPFYNN